MNTFDLLFENTGYEDMDSADAFTEFVSDLGAHEEMIPESFDLDILNDSKDTYLTNSTRIMRKTKQEANNQTCSATDSISEKRLDTINTLHRDVILSYPSTGTDKKTKVEPTGSLSFDIFKRTAPTVRIPPRFFRKRSSKNDYVLDREDVIFLVPFHDLKAFSNWKREAIQVLDLANEIRALGNLTPWELEDIYSFKPTSIDQVLYEFYTYAQKKQLKVSGIDIEGTDHKLVHYKSDRQYELVYTWSDSSKSIKLRRMFNTLLEEFEQLPDLKTGVAKSLGVPSCLKFKSKLSAHSFDKITSLNVSTHLASEGLYIRLPWPKSLSTAGINFNIKDYIKLTLKQFQSITHG